METVKAQLNSYRQSPRKARLIGDLIRGKKVSRALSDLSVTPKNASLAFEKLLKSALANAKNKDLKEEDLFIQEISVNGGPTLYRRRARARGRAMTIRKRTSHISIVLGQISKDKTKKTPKSKARVVEAVKRERETIKK